MVLYYRDRKDGDYLAVDHSTRDYYARIGQPDMREARATAIAQLPSTICTTSVHLGWLRNACVRVARKDIPSNYTDRF